jgi:amino acid permease
MIIFKTSIRKIFFDTFGESDVFDMFFTQEWFLVLLLALMETPLTLVSKMEKLKFMALCGVVGISLFMISFVVFFITATLDDNPANQPAGNMQSFPNDWLGGLAAIPNLLLALNYQMNFFPIFKGMKNVTDRKMSSATLVGISFCVVSYVLVGVLGYDYVGEHT